MWFSDQWPSHMFIVVINKPCDVRAGTVMLLGLLAAAACDRAGAICVL